MAVAKVLNLDKILSKLDNIENIDLQAPLQDACLIVENSAKENCPVDTGELRASIVSHIVGNTGEVGTNVEYAPYVEYGTGVFAAAGNGRQDRWSYQDAEGNWHSTIGQRPQPYLEPALNDNREKIIDLFKKYVEKELNK